MEIIDSHCHAGLSWFEPVEMLITQMDLNNVDKGVLIQHRGVYDNSYLFDCADRFPGRFYVVVLVEINNVKATHHLQNLVEAGAHGIRMQPADRSDGPDPLAIWKKAQSLGLPASILGTLSEFASSWFEEMVRELSELTIVLEHMAGVGYEIEEPYLDFKKVLDLSKYPNVHLKVGGLGEIIQRPPTLSNRFMMDDRTPLLKMALDAFGHERVMWGSDYPPVSNREGYHNALNGIQFHKALGTHLQKEWVMGKTAKQVFQRD
mgnify:FL=1